MRRVGRERQLHLKVRALCGEVEKVFDVLVDTGAQVSLVKAGLLPPECLTDSRKHVRLKVANSQYMVGGTKEAAIGLQFVNHRVLSCPDLGKEILLQGRFYEAEMDWDMIVGYDFMMETDSGVLPAQASMTQYHDQHLSLFPPPPKKRKHQGATKTVRHKRGGGWGRNHQREANGQAGDTNEARAHEEPGSGRPRKTTKAQRQGNEERQGQRERGGQPQPGGGQAKQKDKAAK